MRVEKYDIVYIFKLGSNDSIALRYSLRSLSNIPHGDVFISGDKPDWICNIAHIPVKDLYETGPYKHRVINQWNKVKEACKCPKLSDNFLVFNDDNFILKKVDKFIYYHRGNVPRFERPSGYQRAVLKSAQYFDNPLFFGTHTPVLYNKEKFLSLCNLYDVNKGLDHKIIYCNHYNVSPTERIKDTKIRGIRSMMSLDDRIFLSTHDKIERNAIFKREMDKLFPEKSKYESDVF